MLVLLHCFLSKEWFVGHGLLLISWFRQIRKQDNVRPHLGLELGELKATLSVI